MKTAGSKHGEFENDTLLDGGEDRKFRGGFARANYLAQDRPYISYGTKELCRRMHAPWVSDMKALERLVKYLSETGRLQYRLNWQSDMNLCASRYRFSRMQYGSKELLRTVVQ